MRKQNLSAVILTGMALFGAAQASPSASPGGVRGGAGSDSSGETFSQRNRIVRPYLSLAEGHGQFIQEHQSPDRFEGRGKGPRTGVAGSTYVAYGKFAFEDLTECGKAFEKVDETSLGKDLGATPFSWSISLGCGTVKESPTILSNQVVLEPYSAEQIPLVEAFVKAHQDLPLGNSKIHFYKAEKIVSRILIEPLYTDNLESYVWRIQYRANYSIEVGSSLEARARLLKVGDVFKLETQALLDYAKEHLDPLDALMFKMAALPNANYVVASQETTFHLEGGRVVTSIGFLDKFMPFKDCRTYANKKCL